MGNFNDNYSYKSTWSKSIYITGSPPFYLFADTMRKFAPFETVVELIYKHAIPIPNSECNENLKLGVSFAGGYIAGVFCAIVSHPADNLVSFLNNAKGATVSDGIYANYLNLCPHQASRTMRSEEVVYLIHTGSCIHNTPIFSRTGRAGITERLRCPGDKMYSVFDNQLPAALKRLLFDKKLYVRKLLTEADGYQPDLIAPEQGYR